MKKILIFSLAYYPRVGGAEVAIKEITDRVSDIEFHMVTMRFGPTDAAEEKIGNVLVHRVGNGASYLSKILFVPRAALCAARLHRRQKFDALWAMMSYMLLPVVLLRMSNIRIPYALTLQEGDTERHMFGRVRILLFLPFINFGFRHAAVVQAISTYLGRWASERGFHGPLEIIPNGVDTKRFFGAPVAHRGIVLITASRLVRKNAVDDCLRALAQLPQGATLRIFGAGPDERKLKALARKLGVSARAEFAGHADHGELPRHLHAADIFVRPSRSEGMGNSFVEAFAAGLPVIATQEGGLKDFISSETAFVVRKDSPEDIVAAVREILAHPERTKKVVENARKLAGEKYDWAAIARAMRSAVFARIL